MVLTGHGFNFIATANVRTNMKFLEISLADAPKLQVCANTCLFHFGYSIGYVVCCIVMLICISVITYRNFFTCALVILNPLVWSV